MLIGTAHIIDLDSPLERYIKEFDPDAVALELDKERWFSLRANKRRSGGPIFVRVLILPNASSNIFQLSFSLSSEEILDQEVLPLLSFTPSERVD